MRDSMMNRTGKSARPYPAEIQDALMPDMARDRPQINGNTRIQIINNTNNQSYLFTGLQLYISAYVCNIGITAIQYPIITTICVAGYIFIHTYSDLYLWYIGFTFTCLYDNTI